MISENNFLNTSDGAYIYFEDRGEGLPIVMVPGFLCTSRFFLKNAEELSKKFRVITMDPRGNGYSSKTCFGNNMKRHARDILELIEHLHLENVTLLGWSLAASVVVTYASEFQCRHLNGLALMDGSLFPFSGEDWNHHRGKNYNIQNWLNTYLPLFYNQEEFYDKFIGRISNASGMSEEDRAWITEECRKCMPWTALELHYDFCLTDNVKNLRNVNVPVSVFGSCSKAYGVEMAKFFADQVKGYSEYNLFYESGHLMFIYEAEKFNNALGQFVVKADQIAKSTSK